MEKTTLMLEMAKRFDDINRKLEDYREFKASYDRRLAFVANDPLTMSKQTQDKAHNVKSVLVITTNDERIRMNNDKDNQKKLNQSTSDDPVEDFKKILEEDRRTYIKNYEIEEFRLRKCFEQFTSEIVTDGTKQKPPL